jgi:hypothetical protein
MHGQRHQFRSYILLSCYCRRPHRRKVHALQQVTCEFIPAALATSKSGAASPRKLRHGGRFSTGWPLDLSDSKGVILRNWHKLVCCSTRERWDEEVTVHNCTYLACLEVVAKAFAVEASDGEYRRPAQTVGLTQSK